MPENIAPAMLAKARKPSAYGAARREKPKKFAAASVLAAFKRMRRWYHTKEYEPLAGAGFKVSAPGARGIPLSKWSGLTLDGNETDYATVSKTPFDDYKLTCTSTGDGTDGGNLQVMPKFWSEVQAHFYPIAPQRRHGCWTHALIVLQGSPTPPRELAEYANATGPGGQKRGIRAAISALCSGELIIKSDPAPWQGVFAALPAQLSAYNLMWVDPVAKRCIPVPSEVRNDLGWSRTARDYDPKKIAEFKSVKFAKTQREKGYVNMWDYIMLPRLYAWDWEQQQAVLNAYFGANKEYAGKGAFDPNNKADCEAWRPLRNEDPQDGTHCRVNKVMTDDILAIGR